MSFMCTHIAHPMEHAYFISFKVSQVLYIQGLCFTAKQHRSSNTSIIQSTLNSMRKKRLLSTMIISSLNILQHSHTLALILLTASHNSISMTFSQLGYSEGISHQWNIGSFSYTALQSWIPHAFDHIAIQEKIPSFLLHLQPNISVTKLPF